MIAKGVIFDLDGTLIDSLADIATATNTALGEKGFPTHEISSYRYFVGDGVRALAQRALPPEANAGLVDHLTERVRYHLDAAWHVETKPYEGIPELLQACASQKYALAVLSNKPHHLTKAAVDHFFPNIPFEPIFGVTPEIPPKPELIGARRIWQQWEMEPGDIVYVGDTKTDMATASAAGFFAVGVCWGFRPALELQEHGADAVITHPLQLLDILSLRSTKK